jgi:Proprotein convertase P-domain
MNPWEWTLLPGETNSSLVMSNVDSFINWSLASVLVTYATGETLWLGPAELVVDPLSIQIPASGSSGPASRYPATINVFGQPTNLASVKVTLWDLSHGHSADLDILLVSPSGTNVMLMSHVGGTNGVSHASLVFQQYWSAPSESAPIPSNWISTYGASNYGGISSMPQVGSDPPSAGLYSIHLEDLIGSNPNGAWKLYIYDDHQGGVGSISGSWSLDFTFQ